MSDTTPDAGVRTTRTFTLRNGRNAKLTLVLEPWANEYDLAPEEALQIVEEGGNPSSDLEVRLEDSHVVFFARAGSTLKVVRDGEELP